MENKRILIVLFASVLLAALHENCLSQVSITGPTCIVPATEYQYNISGNWANNSTVTICILGGTIAGTDSSCSKGHSFSMIRVIWNDTSKGRINITSSEGNASLNIFMTKQLQGGNIDSSICLQIIKPNMLPNTIHCSSANGGNCRANYTYQWEQSPDNARWTNVKGNTQKDLSLLSAPARTIYYRRKVTESVSNSIAYSNVATIIVLRQMEANQKKNNQ